MYDTIDVRKIDDEIYNSYPDGADGVVEPRLNSKEVRLFFLQARPRGYIHLQLLL